ncbi:MAG: zf-HC2 domain-containing protein [Polyangiaceae bacterium]
MSAVPKREDPCRVSRSIGAYADGELEPSRSVEVEQHLSVCRSCRDEVEMIAAMRRSLRRSATRAGASASFAERMQALAAMEIAKAPPAPAESVEARSPEPAESGPRLRARLTWAVTVAVAAAAGFVVAFLGSRSDKGQVAAGLKMVDTRPMVSVSERRDGDDRREAFESLIDRLVTFHANPLPSEVDDLDDAVKRFEPYLNVHIQGSALRRPLGAKFSGARIYDIESPLSARGVPNRRYTAELRYTMQGHRFTVYVFDPHAVPIQGTRLKPRVVRSSPVYVGRVRGFSVVAAEKSGIGYAMASDLDDDRSAQLVANFD